MTRGLLHRARRSARSLAANRDEKPPDQMAPPPRWGLWHRGYVLAVALPVAGAVAGAGLQQFDHWVRATELPVTLSETSTEVLDRKGTLMRVYPVGDGIWRMAPQLDQVDPDFIAMLIAYEDSRNMPV